MRTKREKQMYTNLRQRIHRGKLTEKEKEIIQNENKIRMTEARKELTGEKKKLFKREIKKGCQKLAKN